MKYVLMVVMSFLIFLGCKKDEELISGDIEGTVSLLRSNYSQLPPASNIMVDLYSNSEMITSMETDNGGKFYFSDLPYGRYSIRCSYPGFIQSYYEEPIFHVGGYSPTVTDAELLHVPEYQISLDSVTYDTVEFLLKVHLKIDGDTLAPEGFSFLHQFRAFMSNSSDVSSADYTVAAKGILADWNSMYIQGRVAIYGRIVPNEIPYEGFESIKSQPIHMVLYPVANNQGNLPEEYLPGSLGPHSNEVVFDWYEVTNTNP